MVDFRPSPKAALPVKEVPPMPHKSHKDASVGQKADYAPMDNAPLKEELAVVEEKRDPMTFLQQMSDKLKKNIPVQPTLADEVDEYIKKLGSGMVRTHRIVTDDKGASHAVPV